MASHHDGDSSCDETESSLGDSSYDFLDDRSVTTDRSLNTDDEERDRMTESMSSESLESDQHSSPFTAQTRTPHDHLEASSVDLKTPTASGCDYSNHSSPRNTLVEESLAEDPEETIQFVERTVVDLKSTSLTEACHPLRTIEYPYLVEENLKHAIMTLPLGIIKLTVRQTMLSQGVNLKGNPYKVLVVGDDTMKDLVIKKIATALAADLGPQQAGSDDASPAKFNIVPISAFGESGNPDVVLINSSGLELSVEHCIGAVQSRTREFKDILSLRMAGGDNVQSWWWGSKSKHVYHSIHSKDWKLPDLAVFCSSAEDDAQAIKTRDVAQSFMSRHGVPFITIQKKATWIAPTTLDCLTPHICLESRQSSGEITKKRFPVDLSTFLNIDAGLLNRNLACLAHFQRLREQNKENIRQQNTSRGVSWSSEASKAKGQPKTYPSQEYLRPVLRLLRSFSLPLAVLLFSTIVAYLISSGDTGAAPRNKSVFMGATPSLWSKTTTTSITDAITPVSSSIAPASTQIKSSKNLSSNTEIASFLLDAYALGPEKSDKFQLQILGDSHIVINTPQWMHRSRKVPSLLFEVTRQNASIEIQTSKIGEGVFALQIPDEEAYGIITVLVTIRSKSTEQKKFEVDFGTSWLQKGAWKRASRAMSDFVSKDISLVQTGLSVLYNHSVKELSSFVHQTKDAIAAQQKASHLHWHHHASELVQAPKKEVARYLVRLRRGQSQVAQRAKYLKTLATQNMTGYIHKRQQPFSLWADRLAQKIVLAKAHQQAAASEYLKYNQKKALRAWWKIVGKPKISRFHRSTEEKLAKKWVDVTRNREVNMCGE